MGKRLPVGDEWIGMRCRLRSEVRTQLATMTPGTIVTVTGRSSWGTTIRTEPCEHCGVRAIAAKVDTSSLVPLERAFAAPVRRRRSR